MRVRTPDLFSTRIDSVCLRPVRRFPAACSSSRLSGALVAGLAHYPTISRAALPAGIIG